MAPTKRTRRAGSLTSGRRRAAARPGPQGGRQLARHHALIALLVEARGHPRQIDTLAAELGVSERTVERDLESLRAARLPLRGRGGLRGGVWLDVARNPGPLELSPAQVATLVAALASLESPLPSEYQALRESLLRHLTGPRLF